MSDDTKKPQPSPGQSVLPPQDPCPVWANIRHELRKPPEESKYLSGLLRPTDDPDVQVAQSAAMIQVARAELAEQQVRATYALQQTVLEATGALGAMGQVLIQGVAAVEALGGKFDTLGALFAEIKAEMDAFSSTVAADTADSQGGERGKECPGIGSATCLDGACPESEDCPVPESVRKGGHTKPDCDSCPDTQDAPCLEGSCPDSEITARIAAESGDEP